MPVRRGRTSAALPDRDSGAALERSIARGARCADRRCRSAHGHWLFELEADCTIPAEYILMMHFLDEIDAALEAKLAALSARAARPSMAAGRSITAARFDLSCTVKAYYALKLAGDEPAGAAHGARARRPSWQHGGAARANVFTRITLAMFGQVPWRGRALHPGRDHAAAEVVSVPPRQGLVLVAHRDGAAVRAVHPQGRWRRIRARIDIRELFTVPPGARASLLSRAAVSPTGCFMLLDRIGRRIDPLIPRGMRARAIAARRALDHRAAATARTASARSSRRWSMRSR